MGWGDQVTGLDAAQGVDPETSVAVGAALHAGVMAGGRGEARRVGVRAGGERGGPTCRREGRGGGGRPDV